MAEHETVTYEGPALQGAGRLEEAARQTCLDTERAVGNRSVQSVEIARITVEYRCIDRTYQYGGAMAHSDDEFHEADATGVPDEQPIDFAEDDLLEDEERDWDPQF